MPDVLARLRRRRVPAPPETGPGRPAVRALSELPRGTTAIVVGISDSSPEQARRLLDLGFIPGTEVTVGHRAPLGDPTLYRMRDATLCLRRSLASTVLVHDRVTEPDDA